MSILKFLNDVQLTPPRVPDTKSKRGRIIAVPAQRVKYDDDLARARALHEKRFGKRKEYRSLWSPEK